MTIHPRRVHWEREGRADAYRSQIGAVWKGPSGMWHAQAGGETLSEDFRDWKRAALSIENVYGRYSYATAKLRAA